MKLKNFSQIQENLEDDQEMDYFGDEDDQEMYDEEDNQENDADDDVLEHLASLIRQMIKLSDIENFYVYTNKYDIGIQFILNKKERFSSLMKIMSLIKKLSSDTLIQYDSEIDLWENRQGMPLLTVDFLYNTDKKGKWKEKDTFF